MITDDHVRKIAAAGKINQAEFPLLKMVLGCWKEQYEQDVKDQGLNLTPKRQLELAQKYEQRLSALVDLIDEHPQLASEQAQTELRRFTRRTGIAHEDALPRFFRRVQLRHQEFRKRRTLAALNARDLKTEPVLPSLPSARKPAVAHLSLQILLYFGARGRLGEKPPTSDTDPIVLFATAVFELIEGDGVTLSAARDSTSLSPSAVRRRLASEFEGAKQRFTPRESREEIKARLKVERRRRDAWRRRVARQFEKIPSVTKEDARLFAAGEAVDLTRDPREVVRQAVASWDE